MTFLALPHRLGQSGVDERPDPADSAKLGKCVIVFRAVSLLRSIPFKHAFLAAHSLIDIPIAPSNFMVVLASPICVQLGVFGKWSKPNIPASDRKLFIVSGGLRLWHLPRHS